MRQGDYANAVLVLNRSMLLAPGNIEITKDLAQSYYFQGNYARALEVIKPVLDNENADDQTFQIAASNYLHLDQSKEAERVYKAGIKKFPGSGPLYNELGEIQFNNKNYKDAIKSWESGIKADPSYSRNYYNASRYYFLTTDKVWSILYGEIFVNMEPLGNRTPEVKQILLDSYKKLFSNPDILSANTDNNNFAKTYLQVMSRQSASAAAGINAESLSMIRTRFIIDWFAVPNRPAFRLFDLQQQYLKEGLFEAYNQWLFGTVENLSAYDNWIKTHATDNEAFSAFQKGRIFKIPSGQYYK